MSDVLNLVDEMEGYFEECKTVPFSNKVVVDMEVMYEFMTDLRLKLPEEIKRSQRILEEKERIIEDARTEAANAEALAAARVDELVDENIISKKAQIKADELISNAHHTAEEIKLGAFEYAEEIVEQIELAMKDTLEQAAHHYSKFDNYLAQQVRVMQSNREELVASKNRAVKTEE